jgi:hypothetical protein
MLTIRYETSLKKTISVLSNGGMIPGFWRRQSQSLQRENLFQRNITITRLSETMSDIENAILPRTGF